MNDAYHNDLEQQRMSKDDVPNPPAFPCETDGNPNGFQSGAMLWTYPGMTLRDWFAGQCDVAAYGPRAAYTLAKGKNPTIAQLAEYIAEIRMIEADAMLRARLPDAAFAAIDGRG